MHRPSTVPLTVHAHQGLMGSEEGTTVALFRSAKPSRVASTFSHKVDCTKPMNIKVKDKSFHNHQYVTVIREMITAETMYHGVIPGVCTGASKS